MEYIKGLDNYQDSKESAITLGKFDGLHIGHQKLVNKVCDLKKEYGVKSIVCAFDMHPAKELMSNLERSIFLEDKVDALIECPFTESLSKMRAEDFIRDILWNHFRAKYIVVGTDFCFGHGKRGDIHMLSEYAQMYGYELFVIEKEMFQNREISSSFIKEELRQGNLSYVNQMLGYAYSISGQVEHGKKLGRTLGFPTLNVCPDERKLLPPNGVYFVKVNVDDCWYNGICNVGTKPTVSEEQRILMETHLFDFEGEIYGKTVEIQFLQYERTEKKFGSIDDLKAQIELDRINAINYFSA